MHKWFGQYRSELVKKDVYSEVVGKGEACSSKFRKAASMKITIKG